MHWFYTMYFDNSDLIKPVEYEKLKKPFEIANIRTLITILKQTQLPKNIEVIGHFVDTREEATIKGKVIDYEYTSLTANITLVDEHGEEWKVGGLGSYFEDVEGEKFILLE